jgi:general secretion pathway protein D
MLQSIPRIVPNPFDNTLLIQASPQEYAGISKLLRQLDIPPRQILIDAKIFEINLNHGFSSGVEAIVQLRGQTGGSTLATRKLVGSLVGGAVGVSMGALVGQSRELLAILNTAESSGWGKVISAPSVIATDSIPASITVGSEVPTLTGQAVTGFQSGGNSLFAQNIQNRNTGTTLNILARANASGVVTMVLNQEVSAAVAPSASSAIQSPSFSKRNVQTQVTVEDGDTIAISGIIDENRTYSTAGVPGLNRIPIIGAVFGNRSYTSGRVEMIIFLTPRVIYDTAQIAEATNELRDRLRRLRRDVDRIVN